MRLRLNYKEAIERIINCLQEYIDPMGGTFEREYYRHMAEEIYSNMMMALEEVPDEAGPIPDGTTQE